MFHTDQIHTTICYISNRQVSLKRRYIQANQTLFMNNIINKEVIKRSRLKQGPEEKIKC